MARAHGSYPWCHEFESLFRYPRYRALGIFFCAIRPPSASLEGQACLHKQRCIWRATVSEQRSCELSDKAIKRIFGGASLLAQTKMHLAGKTDHSIRCQQEQRSLRNRIPSPLPLPLLQCRCAAAAKHDDFLRGCLRRNAARCSPIEDEERMAF